MNETPPVNGLQMMEQKMREDLPEEYRELVIGAMHTIIKEVETVQMVTQDARCAFAAIAAALHVWFGEEVRANERDIEKLSVLMATAVMARENTNTMTRMAGDHIAHAVGRIAGQQKEEGTKDHE